MWKRFRITVLLLILATVAVNAWRARSAATDWKDTLHVAVYPINADGSPQAAELIAALQPDSFAEIDGFFSAELQRYGVKTLRPVRVTLQPALESIPPALPERPGRFDPVLWSLKLRYWASHQPRGTPRPDVRLYLEYWNPSRGAVPDSHGLREGLIGVAHLYAARSMQHRNAVVIAHELLHTLGATDKYDPATLMPRYPDGYADPHAEPQLPQTRCELMAGRIAVDETRAEQPASLSQCLIGAATAREIGLRS